VSAYPTSQDQNALRVEARAELARVTVDVDKAKSGTHRLIMAWDTTSAKLKSTSRNTWQAAIVSRTVNTARPRGISAKPMSSFVPNPIGPNPSSLSPCPHFTKEGES
jgi:hypothetical protein